MTLTIKTVHNLTILALGSILLLVSPTNAQSKGAQETGAISIDDLRSCKAIDRDADRLRCLDEILSHLPSRTAQHGAAIKPLGDGSAAKPTIGRVSEETDPEEIFGFQAEKVLKSQTIDEISSTIDVIGRTKTGKYIIVLSNGQVWRQLKADTKKLRYSGDGAGAAVTIKKRSLGSHSISIDGDNRSIKVKRSK